MTLEKQLQTLLSDTKTVSGDPNHHIDLSDVTYINRIKQILTYVFSNIYDYTTPELSMYGLTGDFESIIPLDGLLRLDLYAEGQPCTVEVDTSGVNPVYTYKRIADGQTITPTNLYIVWKGRTQSQPK